MKIYILMRSSSTNFPVGVYSSQQMAEDAKEAYAYDYLNHNEVNLYVVPEELDAQPHQFQCAGYE